MFWITFIIYVVAVALYTVMCSGKKQWWAEGYPPKEEEENPLIGDEETQENELDDENVSARDATERKKDESGKSTEIKQDSKS